MLKKFVCIVISALLALCVFSACDNEKSGAKTNEYMLSLEGTWEYTDENGTLTYTFNTDGTGTCMLREYEMPFTFSANETQIQMITDQKAIYEAIYGMTVEELYENEYLNDVYRYVTENYTYVLEENTLTITDTRYSMISGSDIATIELTKVTADSDSDI